MWPVSHSCYEEKAIVKSVLCCLSVIGGKSEYKFHKQILKKLSDEPFDGVCVFFSPEDSSVF